MPGTISLRYSVSRLHIRVIFNRSMFFQLYPLWTHVLQDVPRWYNMRYLPCEKEFRPLQLFPQLRCV